MAGSVNVAILVGNLGRDPEVRNLNDGGRVVTFSLATSDGYKDRNGQWQDRTQWFNIVVWNERLGEFAEKYLRKGSKVYVQGSLQSRKFTDKSGQERDVMEVVLQRFGGTLTSLDAPAGDRGSRQDSKPAQKAAAKKDDFEDEIPW